MINKDEIIEIVKTDSKKIFTPLRVVAGAVVLIGVVLLYAWCSASSGDGVPKAEEYNKQSANAHIDSVKSEGNANVTAVEVQAIDAQRVEANRASTVAKARKDEAVSNLNKRTDQYEKFKKQGVVVSDADLDARERKLLADLTGTYGNSNR